MQIRKRQRGLSILFLEAGPELKRLHSTNEGRGTQVSLYAQLDVCCCAASPASCSLPGATEADEEAG